MLEFVKKDKLPMVAEKIKSIYIKKTGKEKTKFLEDFVDRYKDNEKVYITVFINRRRTNKCLNL